MDNQLFLFEPGSVALPPRVAVFASGANEAREIRGFALAGVPVGVAVSRLREAAIQELLRSPSRVFADSGAFSEVIVNKEGSAHTIAAIADEEWLRRLAIYLRLATVLADRLSVVAPDRVADQTVTLERLTRYCSLLGDIAACGAEVLIPVQKGRLLPAEFYAQAISTAGFEMVPALPMRKAATSFADVLSFVQTARPRRLHFLGMGYERPRARRLVAILRAFHPDLQITMDSNRIRAVTGSCRKMTALEASLRHEQPNNLYAEVEAQALRLSEVHLDYTDSIAFPSYWASRSQLAELAAVLGLESGDEEEFIASPDEFLQRPAKGIEDVSFIELPHVSCALDRAWERYVSATIDVAVRTAAIRRMFADARIATRLSPTPAMSAEAGPGETA
jgi:hypothetical protein